MQIIQSILGSKVQSIGLGVRKPLGYSHGLLSRKESSFLHGQSSAIKPLANHLPLVTYSQFLLSPENPAFSDPVIDSNNAEPEYNNQFPLIQFDTVDVNQDIPNILPSQNSDNNTPELNNQSQSKSKKSQKASSSEAKSKAKSKTQKKTKSSLKNQGNQQGDEIAAINQNIGLIIPDESPVAVINFENNLNHNSRDNIVADDNINITPNASLVNLPITDNEAVFRENLANDETPAITESESTVNSAESATIFPADNIPENLKRSPQHIASETIDNLTHTSVDSAPTPPIISSPIEPIGGVFVNRELDTDEIITEQPLVASKAVNLADVSENVIQRKSDNPTYVPIEFAPTPPVIAQQPIVTSEAVNLDISENVISRKSDNLTHVPVESAPTPPVISSPVEPMGGVFVNRELNADEIITEQPIVASEAVNLADVAENVIYQKFDNPIHVPVESAPTPPVISSPLEPTEEVFVNRELDADEIITEQPQVASDAVNLADVSENVLQQKSENITHSPVEFAPTPPVIAQQPIVTSEAVNLDVLENVISPKSDIFSHLPVESASTLPVISSPIEPTGGVFVNRELNADEIITEQPIVTSEAVNLADVSENVISPKSDNPSHVPVELAPTPPIISNLVEPTRGVFVNRELNADEIITEQPLVTSEAANLADVSEDVILPKSDNPSHVPVELAPTPPVVAQQPIVTSESVNLDVSEDVISPKADISSHVPVQLAPTPPIISSPVEPTGGVFVNRELDADEIITEQPLVTSEAANLANAPDDSQANTEIPTVVTSPILGESTEVEPDLSSKVTSFTFTDNQTESLDNLPAPQGFATGGQVTHSAVENPQIASSDTVPAMLTPGEFVVNANDAQKNLHILRHINTGGAAEEIILPSLEIPTPENPTLVDSFSDTSLQRQKSDNPTTEKSNSLIPASLGTEISKQRLSSQSSLQRSTVENKATAANEASPHYSLPTLIFRKPSANTNTAHDTPSQWSSVEELLNGSNDPFTFFNFSSDGESDSQGSQSSSASPQVFTKRLNSPQGFANGGEVTAPDIATDIQPITETIQSPSAATPKADESENLEALAYEIYNRLRQRIEVERERQGIYLGRLPW